MFSTRCSYIPLSLVLVYAVFAGWLEVSNGLAMSDTVVILTGFGFAAEFCSRVFLSNSEMHDKTQTTAPSHCDAATHVQSKHLCPYGIDVPTSNSP